MDDGGPEWLQVRPPGRTLGQRPPPRSGWISASLTCNSWSAWHVFVDVDSQRVLVYGAGRVLRRYDAIVGKPFTPTPRGDGCMRLADDAITWLAARLEPESR